MKIKARVRCIGRNKPPRLADLMDEPLVPAHGSGVAMKAVHHEIQQALACAKTVGYRLRHSACKGNPKTIRHADADIVELEIIPALRRAIAHLPNTEASQPRTQDNHE